MQLLTHTETNLQTPETIALWSQELFDKRDMGPSLIQQAQMAALSFAAANQPTPAQRAEQKRRRRLK